MAIQVQQRLAAERASRADSRTDLLNAIAIRNEARRIHDYFAAVELELHRLDETESIHRLGRLNNAQKLVGLHDDALHILKNWMSPAERLLEPSPWS